MITTELLIIFALLLLNGFFSLSEMAIVSASRPMLRQMAKDGNRRAAIALALAEDSGRFLSTVQIGITLVGILAGAYGGATIAAKLQPMFDTVPFIYPHGEAVSVTIVVTVITYFSVVIGELVPKQFALGQPEKLAMFVARPMLMLSRICTPVVYILEVSAHILTRVLGATPSDERITEAEVKAVLSEGAETGVIEKAEHEMLQRVIRLGDRDVKSIMTHRSSITFVHIGDTLDAVRARIKDVGHSRYPVIGDHPDKILGIVRAKDLLAASADPAKNKVADYLRPAQTLPENATCLAALEIFKSSTLHMMIVVNEYGGTEGVVTTADLLEAIVGLLPSNYDKPEHALITQRQDGSWLVDGLTPIDEIHIAIGLKEISADDNFDTLAGFVLDAFGKLPGEGDYIDLYGHRFEVADMDGTRIDKIIITPLPKDKISHPAAKAV
jgi:putative hemolysin